MTDEMLLVQRLVRDLWQSESGEVWKGDALVESFMLLVLLLKQTGIVPDYSIICEVTRCSKQSRRKARLWKLGRPSFE